MDAYAAQHPGNAERERRQRGSVAVHLVTLCAAFEHGMAEPALSRVRGAASRSVLPTLPVGDWPALAPPEAWGPANAVTVADAPDGELEAAVAAWAREVWDAWAATAALDDVRAWTAAALGGGGAR